MGVVTTIVAASTAPTPACTPMAHAGEKVVQNTQENKFAIAAAASEAVCKMQHFSGPSDKSTSTYGASDEVPPVVLVCTTRADDALPTLAASRKY